MPGVLILEAMAQAAGILVFRTRGDKPDANTVYYYAGIDEARGCHVGITLEGFLGQLNTLSGVSSDQLR
jgi:hypothetical protein